ncbi:hypothetical protein Dimus_020346 [Dionaea muscipula]
MEEEKGEEVVEDPQNDAHAEASRDDEMVDDVAADPKDDVHYGVSRDSDKNEDDVAENPNDVISIGVSRDVMDMDNEVNAAGKGLEMVVYRDSMEEQNQGITKLSEHLKSKIFTDNEKENLLFLRLEEIKTHIRNSSITITKTLKSVADIVSSKVLDNETRLKNIEATINEIAKSQTALIELLLNFIEDTKKGEDYGKEQRGYGSKGVEGSRTAQGKFKEESRIRESSMKALTQFELAEFQQLFTKGYYKKLSRSDALYQFCDSGKTKGLVKKAISKKKTYGRVLTITESTEEFER